MRKFEYSLGCGHNLFVVCRLWTTRARLAGWFGDFGFGVIVIGKRNRGWQHRKIKAGRRIVGFFAVVATRRAVPVTALWPFIAARAPVFGGGTRAALFAFAGRFVLGTAVRTLFVIGRRAIVILPFIAVVVAIFITAVVPGPTFALLLRSRFLTASEIGENAEIMVGELQMIFGVDTVVVELRVLRHFFVFFEHLRGVATRAIVDAVVIIEPAAVILLLPIIVIIVVATATPIIVVRLAAVVIIHRG
jgi:hypothetical protein